MTEATEAGATASEKDVSRHDFVLAIVKDVLAGHGRYSDPENELITNVVLTQGMVPEAQWLDDQHAYRVDFAQAHQNLERYLFYALYRLQGMTITLESLTEIVNELRAFAQAQEWICEHPWDFLCPEPSV